MRCAVFFSSVLYGLMAVPCWAGTWDQRLGNDCGPGVGAADKSIAVVDHRFRQAIFVAGEHGYHTFRIPSLVVSPRGTLLAFCEGRVDSSGDAGNIDMVLRRSVDGGLTWQALQIVWDDGANTCGNPCAVVEQGSGTIWLLMTHNAGRDTEAAITAGTSSSSRTVWVTHSTDDGASWSPPSEITAQVKRSEWTWYATGPGVGIQIRDDSGSPHAGRMVIPCNHTLGATKEMYSHVIFSDDQGKTWQLGGAIGPACNESQVAQVGSHLMINMRSYRGNHRRLSALSADGGLTWSDPREDETLIEPVCQASLIAVALPNRANADGLVGGHSPAMALVFSNPASTRRERMTAKASIDRGLTWPFEVELHTGPAAYSCLAQLNGDEIGCLFECGERGPYEAIVLERFALSELMQAR